tara:strand:- start:2453 stop:2695 length:243 start_codon:yes stop_codon:yes gene_type:complete
MKAIVKAYDPSGVVLEEEEFTFPIVKEPEGEWRTEIIDGIEKSHRYEPMRKVRYLLKIGEYKYWFRSNGELDPLSSNPEN